MFTITRCPSSIETTAKYMYAIGDTDEELIANEQLSSRNSSTMNLLYKSTRLIEDHFEDSIVYQSLSKRQYSAIEVIDHQAMYMIRVT